MEQNRDSMLPLISIVLPVFNGEKFLAQSIESCLKQTYKNIELIIVNDCSTDLSWQIAEGFRKRDKRISIINNSMNKKLPASLNIGHRAARGKFITWTSDDNYFEPNAIESLYFNLIKSKADIVSSNFTVIKDKTKSRKEVILHQNATILLGNAVGVCFLYRKDVFIRNGGYDEDLHTVEDYDFWLRAALHSSFSHCQKILYNYRNHQESLSTIREQNISSQKLFFKRLDMSYLKFFSSVESANKKEYSSLFSKLHLHKEIVVQDFLKTYDRFKIDMKTTCAKIHFSSYGNLIKEIDLRIRDNIQHYSNNQNVETLTWVLKKRPLLLFRYDRRQSWKIILKCIKKN